MATSNNKTEITNSNNSSNDNATNIEDRETIIRTHSEIRSASDHNKKINYQVTSFSIIFQLLNWQSHLLFLSEVSKSSDSLRSQRRQNTSRILIKKANNFEQVKTNM